MFVHAVCFWGHPHLSDADKEAWLKGLHTLPGIETVQHGYVGVPAETHRDVVENTYTYCIDSAVPRQGRPRPLPGPPDSPDVRRDVRPVLGEGDRARLDSGLTGGSLMAFQPGRLLR